MDGRSVQTPHVAQVAFAVHDLPRTCRFYVDVLGFRRAGGRVLWGPGLSVVQDLGEDAMATLWWVLGGQDFVQLEFFHHTLPVGRPRPADWRPCDLGWVRVGIGVAELDATLARAAGAGHRPLGPIVDDRGVRRAAIADPDGVVVELIEDGGIVGEPPRPAVRYAALSVADIKRAHRFWIGTCGLSELEPATMHSPEHEALWGLPGAVRDVLVAVGGPVALEIVQYRDPVGAPRLPDARLCDHGLLNVALAYRDRDAFDRLLGNILAEGYRATVECPPGPFASTYVFDDQANSVEIFCHPPDHDGLLGFDVEVGFAPGVPLDA